jgi:hypothetical protein
MIRRALTRLVHVPRKSGKKWKFLVATHRVVSPIRFLGRDRFLALCLSREEPRQFYLDRCRNMRPAQAADFLMPVSMAD